VDTWNLDQLGAGLAIGGVASGLLLVLYLAAGVGGRRPLPIAGVVIAAGGLLSIGHTRPVPNAVLAGVIGIGAAAGLVALPGVPLWFGFALAIPFAWAIGFQGDVIAVSWVRVLVTAGVSGGAILATRFDHAWRQQAPGLTLLVITAVGMYATVPDTELPAAALGVVLPFVVLGWPARVATLGRPGAAAAVAVLVWSGAVGATGRPASMVAVVACLGLLAGNPLGEFLLPHAGAKVRRWSRRSQTLAMVISHTLLVIAASRVLGKVSDPAFAAMFGAVLGGVAVLVGARFRPTASPRARQLGDAS
jgi:hypothetical protein